MAKPTRLSKKREAEYEEWILLPNTKYTVRLTNLSGAAAIASIEPQFYENG